MEALRILIITDMHYVETAHHICTLEKRKAAIALRLAASVIRAVKQHGVDLIVILGDLVDNGDAEGAETDIKAIKDMMADTGLPVIVVPGNHDGDQARVLDIFSDYAGLHSIGDYQIVTFCDQYDGSGRCTRDLAGMERVFNAVDRTRPLLVFQHNPVYPPIESSYPYNILNAEAIMNCYQEREVVLSFSGHYHQGIPLSMKDGVGYITCGALCEEPYKYTILTINHDKKYEVQHLSLCHGDGSGDTL